MNNSNIVTFIAALTISIIFFANVFVNLQIKAARLEVFEYYKEIDQLKNEIKRKKIEIAALTNPGNVLKHIEKEGMISVPLKNIEYIKINEKKIKNE